MKEDKNRCRKKKINKNIIYLTLPIVLVILITFTACSILTPVRYKIKEGDVAQENILSPIDTVDEAKTSELKQRARDRAEIKYMIDVEKADATISQCSVFFSSINSVRERADEIRGLLETVEYLPWNSVLSEENFDEFRNTLEMELPNEQLITLITIDENEVLRLKDLVLSKTTTLLRNGVSERNLQSTIDNCIEELKATSISDEMQQIGIELFNKFIVVTRIVDEEATETSRQAAEDSVEDVKINAGDIIVSSGDTVTQSQINILESLDLLYKPDIDLRLHMGITLYVLISVIVYYGYLFIAIKTKVLSINKMVIIALAIAISVVPEIFFKNFNQFVSVQLIAVIIIALLVSKRAALATTILLSTLSILICGSAEEPINFTSVSMAFAIMICGCVSVVVLVKKERRSTIMAAGVIGGICGAIALGCTHIIKSVAFLTTLENCAILAGGCLFSTVFCIGTLPVWENAFDVVTSAKLGELINMEHPLIKRLMIEAPGTYHHSIMVSALAENAAQAVGANSMLAKVGAYYHDVGKLREPLNFKENQNGKKNIHDDLSPEESAKIIIDHQVYGVKLLKKYKLPTQVIKIAQEHHGNTLVAYFYYKAKELRGNDNVDENDFRYPSEKPDSKESVIVMMADSCEAAVRSIQEPTPENIKNMVHKVIYGKITDGQLENAPITMAEIKCIEDSFMNTFSGILHERIEYPEDK